MRCKTGALDDAISTFSCISRDHVLPWNAFLQAHARNGSHQAVLGFFGQMLQEGVMPNKVTYVCVLSTCAVLLRLSEGLKIHACLHQSKLGSNVIVKTALVDMHGKCGCIENALQLFDSLAERDAVAFNALMNCLLKDNAEIQVFQLFEQMLQEGAIPSRVTYIIVVEASSTLNDGELVCCRILSSPEYKVDVSIANALIQMYSRCNHPLKAEQIFLNMERRDTISWNSMMGVYYSQGRSEAVLHLFSSMQDAGFAADECTYVALLSSCACVKAYHEGLNIHHCSVCDHLESKLGVSTAAFSMYGRFGNVVDTHRVFHLMKTKTLVAWNAIISVCCQHDKYEDAIWLFCDMLKKGTLPDKVTLIQMITTCTNAGLFTKGEEFSLFAFKLGYESDHSVGSSLVSMYGKSGELETAHRLFLQISSPNLCCWNVALNVCACYGDGEGMLRLFEKLLQNEKFVPDNLTFIAVLSGCDYIGLVGKAIILFSSMQEIYAIVPSIPHFVCIIDLLGRAGQLEEAAFILDFIPMLSDEPFITAFASAYHDYHVVRMNSTFLAEET